MQRLKRFFKTSQKQTQRTDVFEEEEEEEEEETE